MDRNFDLKSNKKHRRTGALILESTNKIDIFCLRSFLLSRSLKTWMKLSQDTYSRWLPLLEIFSTSKITVLLKEGEKRL